MVTASKGGRKAAQDPSEFRAPCGLGRAAARPYGLLAVMVLTGALFAGSLPAQDLRFLVTAFDEKTGEPLTELGPENFAITDGSTPLRVLEAVYSEEKLDVMLLADSSSLGEIVTPLVGPMIEGLPEGDQLALVGFDQSATLLQDFTSSKDLLRRAWSSMRYGNNPRILDGLYAVLDGGFENTTAQRVAVVLAAGIEGSSRTPPADVLELARRRGVQIHFAYIEGADSRLMRDVAERTGGSWFHAKKLDLKPDELAERVYSVIKGRYAVSATGVATLGPRLKVEVVGLPKSKAKPTATLLAID